MAGVAFGLWGLRKPKLASLRGLLYPVALKTALYRVVWGDDKA